MKPIPSREAPRDVEKGAQEHAEILNQANEAIILTDLEGRVLYWNAGAEELFGWAVDEALGKTASEIYDKEAAEKLAQAREETTANGSWQGDIAMRDKWDRPVFVEVRRTLIRGVDGRPKAHLSICTDITEKRRFEDQRFRAQRLENIGLLAAGIAHDLNNVLAPILLAAPILRERLASEADLQLLSMLERSAEKGSGLVRQLLAFANGAAARRRVVEVKPLLMEIAAMIAQTFPKEIRFEDEFPMDAWQVEANSLQIYQVLLNLCMNARDAMPGGGVLRVRGANVMLDEQAARAIRYGRPGAHLLLEVSDTGTGIEPEVLEKMWEPFFTTKERDKGTGLGLSTVRGIVANHRGFIDVETAVGRGTTFRVYLPAARKPSEVIR